MRILEVRDGFIKFETKESITLASFVEAQDNEKNYIAQIVRTKKTGEYTIAFAKILYLYDGLFNKLNGSTPSITARLKYFPYELINKSFDGVSTIAIGNSLNDETLIKLSKDVFNKNLLASINNPKTIINLTHNLTSEFSKTGKVLVIDTLGILECKKSIAGIDFKLPLNTESLTFMYEDCLTDATTDSKNLTKDIFQELGEYSRTVPFLPFSALKAIIDEMVEKQHIFKLLVLKNKLAKFDKQGYFASTSEDAKSLETLLNSRQTILDLSKLDPVFLNRYLNVIYSTIKILENKPQIIVLASNSINKKALKPMLTEQDISTSLITNSRFRYLNDIKAMVKNFIIEPNFANNENFKTYSMFLSAMPKDSCLVVGDGTNSIPLLADVQELEFPTLENETEIESESEVETDAVVLENEGNNEENFVEIILPETVKDEQTVAIEKKSEVLIERLTEEVETTTPSEIGNLFNEEEISSDETEEINIVETSSNEQENSIDTDETEIVSSENKTFGDSEQFSTEVHPVIIEETPEIVEIEIPNEISELTIEDTLPDETQLQNTEELLPLEDIDKTDNIVAEEINIIEELPIEYVADKEYLEEIQGETGEVEQTPNVIPLNEDTIDEIVEINDEDYVNDEEILVELDIEETSDIIDFEEISSQDLDDDDILVKVLDEEMQNDEFDREIAEDVDRVFTTIKEQIEDDTVSDSDLDFIDELNSEKIESNILEEYSDNGSLEELTEDFSDNLEAEDDGFVEPLEEFSTKTEDNFESEVLETKSTSTPIVPVYEADIPKEDMVMSDPIEQGDSVIHAKYGNGIVEKMINYGTKTLYSINFENVGRRLLDPTLTEIKKS